MKQIGDIVPDTEIRTDEGTPLTLCDLKGRAVAVFLFGKSFTKNAKKLAKIIEECTGRFLALDISPVAIIGESVKQMAEFRSENNVPYLMLSDTKMELHKALREDNGEDVAAWLVDKDGVVTEVIPELPPVELVKVVVERAGKVRKLPKLDQNRKSV